LPIIASDHPGNRTFVRHGENGFLVEHGNHRALADAVLALLRRRDELPRFGRASRAIAEGYSWRLIAERYEAVFKQAIAWKARG
jgi:glycosyltransferase involved in cell wall biosynthesis